MAKKNQKTPPNSSSADAVERYARAVVSGKEIAGPLVRLACERHLRDLVDGPSRGLKWDRAAAERALEFFPVVLRLAGGEHEGRPFVLHPSQEFIVGSLFGWKGPDGYRRFRVAFIEIGKGNGKSPLAAGIGLYMLTADDEPRAEIYAAAVDREQAQILFRDAVAMVDQSEALGSRLSRSGGAGKEWNLAYLEKGSFFRPISSEHTGGRGKSGPRPHCALMDEVHEHPGPSMIEFMRAGTKGRRQALIFMITNSGVFDPASVYMTYHDYAAKVLQRQLENDSLFAYVCGLDPCEDCRKSGRLQPDEKCTNCDDWRNPLVWRKANPLLGVSISEKYLRELVREAEGMPSKQSVVRRLNFCEIVESAEPFVDPAIWAANGGEVRVEELRGRKCWGGLDLSGKNALTSLELVFEPGREGKQDVLTVAWTPKDGLKVREEQDRASYGQWVRDGQLLATPGKTIDYRYVAKEIGRLVGLYDIQAIAFDRWRIEDLEKALDAEGVDIELIEHGQGFKDMNPAVEALEDALLESKLRHGNHPVLTWCVSNVRVVQDPSDNRKFDKRKATGRIDCAVALAMACNLAMVPDNTEEYLSPVVYKV